MKLEVGKKYRFKNWDNGEWVRILYIGSSKIFTIDQDNYETSSKKRDMEDFLQFSEPVPKNLDDTLLWYWEHENIIGGWVQLSGRYTEKGISMAYKTVRKLEALGSISKEDK